LKISEAAGSTLAAADLVWSSGRRRDAESGVSECWCWRHTQDTFGWNEWQLMQ